MDLKKQGKGLKRTLMSLKYSKKPKYDPKKVAYGPNNEPIKPALACILPFLKNEYL